MTRRSTKRASFLALIGAMLITCGGDKPARFDMYTLGASFRETDSIARHVESRAFLCLPDVGTYRECWLQSPNNYRFTILTIDPEDRVIVIRQKLDSAEFRKRGIETVSTNAKREFLTAQWSRKPSLYPPELRGLLTSPIKRYDAIMRANLAVILESMPI